MYVFDVYVIRFAFELHYGLIDCFGFVLWCVY